VPSHVIPGSNQIESDPLFLLRKLTPPVRVLYVVGVPACSSQVITRWIQTVNPSGRDCETKALIVTTAKTTETAKQGAVILILHMRQHFFIFTRKFVDRLSVRAHGPQLSNTGDILQAVAKLDFIPKNLCCWGFAGSFRGRGRGRDRKANDHFCGVKQSKNMRRGCPDRRSRFC